MPLQTTYRPLNFSQVVGNEEAVAALKAALKEEDHNHAMLFTGGSGTGKTTLARIVASRLKAYDPEKTSNPGFREINAADFRGIDTIRTIRDESSRVPLGAPVRVFFMDECHQLTSQAQEMFLKILEEAEGYNYYLFATTNPERLGVTFKRRVAEYKLLSLTEAQIIEHLAAVCEEESIEAPGEVLTTIANDCMGSIGIAIGILDAIKGLSGPQMVKAAQSQAAKQNAVIDLCRALAKAGVQWKTVAPILKSLKEQDEDAEGIRRMILGYCSNWLLKGPDVPRAYVILDCFAEPMYNIGFPGIVRACYMVVNS